MNFKKQVEKDHYEFNRYISKERWCSMWHQLDEIQKLKPKRVLEIGPGPGLFKMMAMKIGIHVETLDIDPDLKPDHIGSAMAMPFDDATYDVVCAFQMLEHLPYESSLQAFAEMVRVSRRGVVISLPDSRPVWRYKIHVPKLGHYDFFVPRPRFKAPIHKFDGEHYWEVNKRDYQLSRVINDFSAYIQIVKTYRVFENPTHRFFIFHKDLNQRL
jgi:SAM-dependent methyltransferase